MSGPRRGVPWETYRLAALRGVVAERVTRTAVTGVKGDDRGILRARIPRPHDPLGRLRRLWDRSTESQRVEPTMRWSDVRLVPAALCLWAATWCGTQGPDTLVVATVVTAALVLVLTGIWVAAARASRSRRRRRRTGWKPHLVVCCIAAAAALGSSAIWLQVGRPAALVNAIDAQETVTVDLVVDRDPGPASGTDHSLSFSATVVGGRFGAASLPANLPVQVRAASASEVWHSLTQGSVVQVIARLKPADPGQEYAARLSPQSAPRLLSPAPVPLAFLSQARQAFREGASAIWGQNSADAAALLPGMVLGDRSAQEPTLDQAMKLTGLTHLTAVSGSNCTLVVFSVLLLFRTMRAQRKVAATLALLALGGFVLVVGPDPSVLRAAVMGALGLLALGSGRAGQGLPLLSAAVMLLLLSQPWLSHSLGFILSVAATAGLMTLGVPLHRALARRLPDWLAAALAVPIAAQLACAPLVVFVQPALMPYSLISNVLADPVVAACTLVGMLGLLVCCIAPVLGVPLIWLAGWASAWVGMVARFFAGLPGAGIPWPEGWAGFGLMTAVSALSAALLLIWCRSAELRFWVDRNAAPSAHRHRLAVIARLLQAADQAPAVLWARSMVPWTMITGLAVGLGCFCGAAMASLWYGLPP
ncbi:ComEC/Rec2 family competence protein [Psychromicrobium xiongbiense]|uniref:ComEC/Rec2 family competence protein n=1 Tax=Psychromicrobium xiongbiense TaxID=3051184 RepID=UPI0025526D86|nr:ComEC/Rec2 family competence protein [Psychromicrobium sp. YIM S02556]